MGIGTTISYLLKLQLVTFLFFTIAFSKEGKSHENPLYKVTIEWQFKHVRPGYSYTNYLQILIDGDTLPFTPEFHQNEVGSFDFWSDSLPHNWQVTVVALYKNVAMYYMKSNDFQIDAQVKMNQLTLHENTRIRLCFDLDSDQPKIQIRPLRTEKEPTLVPLELKWNYFGVVEGYDHLSYYVVFVDNCAFFISDTVPQTQIQPAKVLLPKGRHQIRISSYCNYHEQWEEQLKANGYSIDGMVVEKRRFHFGDQLEIQCFILQELVLPIWKRSTKKGDS